MAEAKVFDARSGDTSSLDLEGPRFTTEPNEHVIHRAVVAELDARRRYTASTKGRSEIRGSGAKLYRQKGTGRARAGDAKSPVRYAAAPGAAPRPSRRVMESGSTAKKPTRPSTVRSPRKRRMVNCTFSTRSRLTGPRPSRPRSFSRR